MNTGIWKLSRQWIRRIFCGNSVKSVSYRVIVESNFIIVCIFFLVSGFLVLMELVEKLQNFNEYGEFETVKPGDWSEASVGADVAALAGEEVGASGAGGVFIVSFLAILFMFTSEKWLGLLFPPDGCIWASGTMVEAAQEEVAVRARLATEKTAASGLASLLRDTGCLVASLGAL